MGILAYAKKYGQMCVPEKSIKNAAQRRWPQVCKTLHSKVMAKNFFTKKMPCIFPYKAINIIFFFNIRNDIALLKVNRDFDCFERRLYPACLPTRWKYTKTQNTKYWKHKQKIQTRFPSRWDFQKYNKIQKTGNKHDTKYKILKTQNTIQMEFAEKEIKMFWLNSNFKPSSAIIIFLNWTCFRGETYAGWSRVMI